MRDCANARGPVYMWPAVVSARLSGVNRHPHAQWPLLRPRFFAQLALDCASRRDRVACARKHGEDAVTFPAFKNERTVMCLNSFRNDFVMPLQRSARLIGMR